MAASLGISTGKSATGNASNSLDMFDDVGRLVAHPLQVRIDLDHREDKPQVNRHRLFHCKQVERHLIDLPLRAIDRRLCLQHQVADMRCRAFVYASIAR